MRSELELFDPGHLVATADVRALADEYRFQSTGSDPQFIIKPNEPIPRGWYDVILRADVPEGRQARVYFDLGRSFQERYATALIPGSGLLKATVRLHKPAVLLRVDPLDAEGEFSLEGLKVVRVGAMELILRRITRLAQTMGSDLTRINRAPSGPSAIWSTRGFVTTAPHGDSRQSVSYAAWMDKYDYNPSKHRNIVVSRLNQLAHRPLISILMPVYNTPDRFLNEAIESVVNQIYPDWELCIADDCSTAPSVARTLTQWTRRDPRIKAVRRRKNGHISEATNSAMRLASGEWVALLDHDDVLREHALAEVALAIAARPDAQLIYSDEDKIDNKGNRFEPHFKCDFAPELFRSMNYLNHLTVHRAENIRAVGGWRRGFEGSQDYDLNLRIFDIIDPRSILHIPRVLYHWRATEGSTALAGTEKTYAFWAGWRALEDHLAGTNTHADVCEIERAPYYRIRHAIATPTPGVSIIIPTKDRVDLLRICIESIVAKTTYEAYEILIVDNNSSEDATLQYFAELSRHRNVRVLPYPHPFNYSAINNAAVQSAAGSMVALVNNDIEVIDGDWLTEMVSWAQQPGIGCVGAKLLYPDGRIQHAGVILGIGGVAGHSHKYAKREELGYNSRLMVVQNVSAVTGACLLVRKAVFEQVSGLDEEHLRVAFNDVDFCLKVREAGYRNVWTPFAELYHHESVSRGVEDTPEKQQRFRYEVEVMQQRWGAALRGDPYYSRSLTITHEDFSLKE